MPRLNSPELLDDSAWRDRDELRANLRDMARYDRWLGVFDDVLRRADLHCAGMALDVGVGSGELIAQAQRRAPHTRWVALDLSREVLNITHEQTPVPQVQGRAQQLPFVDGAFDVVTCSNTLHHLTDQDAVWLLRECARVSRRVVIADLVRSSVTLAGAWVLTRLTSRNRLTRADGVHSARRAFTIQEAMQLVQKSGIPDFVIHQPAPVRFTAVWERSLRREPPIGQTTH